MTMRFGDKSSETPSVRERYDSQGVYLSPRTFLGVSGSATAYLAIVNSAMLLRAVAWNRLCAKTFFYVRRLAGMYDWTHRFALREKGGNDLPGID